MIGAAILAAFGGMTSAPVAAQPSPFVLRTSTGVSGMVTADQLGRLRYQELGFSGGVTGGYVAAEWLTLELRASGEYFLSDATAGAVAEVGAGVRLSMQAGLDALHLQAAAHLDAAWTGPYLLPALDVGIAFAWSVGEEVTMGPEFTYTHVFWTDGPEYSTDAGFITAGLFLAWRPVSAPPRVVVRTIERTRVVERTIEHWEEMPAPPAPAPPAVEIDRLLDRALPVTSREEIILIPPVLFAFDSTRVLPAGEVALHSARDLLAEMPDAIVIEGHADGRGTDEYNAELSLARAMVVRDWLVAHGIDGARLEVEAYGEHRPLEEETDEHRRQMDRRVTFRVTRVRAQEAPAP